MVTVLQITGGVPRWNALAPPCTCEFDCSEGVRDEVTDVTGFSGTLRGADEVDGEIEAWGASAVVPADAAEGDALRAVTADIEVGVRVRSDLQAECYAIGPEGEFVSTPFPRGRTVCWLGSTNPGAASAGITVELCGSGDTVGVETAMDMMPAALVLSRVGTGVFAQVITCALPN